MFDLEPELEREKLTPREQQAWDLYCRETAGSMDCRDYWSSLPKKVQELFIARI
jgi:hypothetical protein